MRASKEEKVVHHSENILKKLENISSDGVVTSEYRKLLSEYKRLQKRFEKTIKQSDMMGHGIMNKNDSLNDNLQYTLKTARTKLMDTIVEQRKIKEISNKTLVKLKMLEKSYDELYEQNSINEKKLKHYIAQYGNIKESVYVQDSTKSNTKIEVNPPFYRNKTIHQAILLESPSDKSQFVISKIGIKDVESVLQAAEQLTSLNTFLVAIYKYIKSYLNDKEDFLFHHKKDEFYVLSNKKEIEDIEYLMDKLNTKREIMDIKIEFIATITKFVEEEDTEEVVLQRCDYAFSKVRKEKLNNIMII